MGNIVSSFSSAPSSESPENYVSSSSSAPSSESPEKYVPSSKPPKKYDVFINFRGDTRNIFTRHLYDALKRNKIETYIDYRIEKGDEVWPAIVEAIENSLLFLVIFSQDYASSTWCLKELDRILELNQGRKRRVIPVFYYIKPTDVRKQTARSYEEAFSKYENSNHRHQVGRWKAALAKAAELGGFESSAYSGDEVALIEAIVKCVREKSDLLYQSSSLDGLIGIQEQIAQVEALLCNESQDVVRFIGIWGMGGIGKTKIAEELFNKLCCEFESSCFLANVREESEKHGIMQLKNKLFSKLLEDKESYMDMPNGITTYAQRRLAKKKVLVVFDDVNDPQQLQKLAGEHKWFGLGSRIIITTRYKQVFGKTVNGKYEVRPLEFQEALQLFYLNAFGNDCFDEQFRELSRKVVEYAKGIPLVLVVLGSLLYDKGKDKWISQLEKLKKMPCPEVQKILQLSYDELDHEEKNMFLDIACILKGRRVEVIKDLFDAYGYSIEIGLDRLQDKALITISNNVVSMHDLIQEMGREIVRKNSSRNPGQQSHLWDTNDIFQVMKHNKGSEAIRAISLDASKIEELKLSPLAFAEMPQLKFLEISLPHKLRYLRPEKCLLKSLPSTFSPEKLVVLDMQYGKMRTMWNGVENRVFLKVMKLSRFKVLMELPDLSGCSSLSFPLDRCKILKNTSINLFDGLRSLSYISLVDCLKLQCLPELPPSLRQLCADICPSLETVNSVASQETTFKNCNNLSEHSVKAIEANLMVHINRSLSQPETCNPDRPGYISVKYSGSKVPEWFKYRTTHHPITIDLSSAPPSMDWGLIFCIYHGPTPNQITIRCRLRISEDNALEDYPYSGYGSYGMSDPYAYLTSDHVEICYDEYFCHRMHQRIKKSRATSNSKIVLTMEVLFHGIDSNRLIKECGVCPTYESEYQNFMKQMGLESQASASRTQGDEWKEDYTLFDYESIRDKKRPGMDNN